MAYEAAGIIKECEEKAQKFKNEALEKARQQAADAKMRVQELTDKSKKQASDETGKIIDEAHRMAENYINLTHTLTGQNLDRVQHQKP